jgi:hypothetical protein
LLNGTYNKSHTVQVSINARQNIVGSEMRWIMAEEPAEDQIRNSSLRRKQ